jgi:DNA-binding GntR family transcriptional regulator
MNTTEAFQAAVEELGNMLEAQRLAILDGRADDLPRLSADLHARVSALLGSPVRAQSHDERLLLRDLRLRARVNQDMINRRQLDVKLSLDALIGHESSGSQANSVYAAAGLMEGPVGRGRAFARA